MDTGQFWKLWIIERSTMKIHFLAFIGVEYDMDLMPFWIPFYVDRKFDTYKVFLHREEGQIDPEIINHFRQAGFSVKTCNGPYGHGLLQKLVFDNYVKTLPPEDFVVVADADEFQSSPNIAAQPSLLENVFTGPHSPIPVDYRGLLKFYDIITGFMVDRYSDKLENCCMNPFSQYPYEEPFTREILKAFYPPYLHLSEWPHTRRTKILAARAGSSVAYEGSHCMIEAPEKANIAVNFRVYHFAWRKASKQKIIKKCYYTQATCKEILGEEATEEVLDKRVVPERVMKI